MKKIAALILFFLASGAAFAQTYVILVRPAGSKLWGYADLTGNLIIPARYDWAEGFSADGIATIYEPKGDKLSFIKLNGEQLAPQFKFIQKLAFDLASFSSGLAPVTTGDGNWGYLNTQGQIAIPFKYDKTYEFRDGYGFAKRADHFIILKPNGEETPVNIPNIIEMRKFSEGFAPYETIEHNMGFMDTSGNIAMLAQFLSVGYFSAGAAWVKTAEKKVGYIRTDGKWIITPQLDVGNDFDPISGLARVKTDEGWGYMDKGGKISFFDDTNHWGVFSEGLAMGKKNGKFGYFNSRFEWAIEPQFDDGRPFKNGYAAVQKGANWGVVDKEGKWVIGAKFSAIKDVELVK